MGFVSYDSPIKDGAGSTSSMFGKTNAFNVML